MKPLEVLARGIRLLRGFSGRGLCFLVALLLITTTLWAAGEEGTEPRQLYMIVVTSSFEVPISPLVQADEDGARRIEEILRSKYGYQDGILLMGRDAEKSQIEKGLRSLERRISSQDSLFVYSSLPWTIAGRGGQALMLPHDGRPDYSRSLLEADILMSSRARSILIVTTQCSELGASLLRENRSLRTRGGPREIQFLNICPGQGAENVEGIFADGLEGRADLDGDGTVTAGEMARFLRDVSSLQAEHVADPGVDFTFGSTVAELNPFLVEQLQTGSRRDREAAISDLVNTLEFSPSRDRERLVRQLRDLLLPVIADRKAAASTRESAVLALRRFSDRDSLGALNDIWREPDDDLQVRTAIMEAMLEIDRGAALPMVLDFLDGGDSALQIEAVSYLAVTTTPDEVDVFTTFLQLLQSSDSQGVRLAVLQSFPAFKPTPDQVGDRLLRILQEESNPWIRTEAIRQLGNAGVPEAVEPLLGFLEADSEEMVRVSSAYALGSLVDNLNRATIREGLQRALQDPSSIVQRVARNSLSRLFEIGDQLLEQLLGDLTSEDVSKRAGAARSLGKLSTPRVITALVELLQLDKSPQVRFAAVTSLGEIGDPEAFFVLAQTLTDGTQSVREAARRALDRIQLNADSEVMTAALEADSSTVRVEAVEKLGRSQDPDVARRLVGKLSDPARDVRESAIRNLTRFGDQATLDMLGQALRDPSYLTRLGAVRLLGYWAPPESHVPLSELLTDGVLTVQREVLRALGRYTEESVSERLMAALRNPQLVEAATEGLVAQVCVLFQKNDEEARSRIPDLAFQVLKTRQAKDVWEWFDLAAKIATSRSRSDTISLRLAGVDPDQPKIVLTQADKFRLVAESKSDIDWGLLSVLLLDPSGYSDVMPIGELEKEGTVEFSTTRVDTQVMEFVEVDLRDSLVDLWGYLIIALGQQLWFDEIVVEIRYDPNREVPQTPRVKSR